MENNTTLNLKLQEETTNNELPNSSNVQIPPNKPVQYVTVCPDCNKTLLRQKKENLWRCFICKKNITTVTQRISMAKGVRRDISNLPIIKRDDLIKTLNNNPDTQNNALISILYLTGGRITEILSLTKEQIEWDDNNPNDPLLIIKNRPILKKKKYGKEIPKHSVPIHVKQEPDLCQHIKNYAENALVQAKLFDFNRQKATIIIQKTLGKQYFIHWLRHSRVTDLFLRKKLPEQVIVKWMGWSDSRQFQNYSHIKTQELAELTKD